MEIGETHPATGNFSHTVYYAGQSFGVMTEHAQLIAKAISDAALAVRADRSGVLAHDSWAAICPMS